jgi:hypothetical protein
MRISLPLLCLLTLAPGLFTADCAVDTETEESMETQQAVALGAKDGPFSGSIASYVDADGRKQHRLRLTYTEQMGSKFLDCWRFPQQQDITVVFVTGPTSTTRPMRVSCPLSYGDNQGVLNHADLTIDQGKEPDLWNTLFPAGEGGSRWYALRVAAKGAHGGWDSRYGADYRLVFGP